MMGVGPGGLASDFELFNVPDVAVRNRMVVEAMDFIQRIWSQDPPYDLKGEFWQVRIQDRVLPELGIGFLPKPFQQLGPSIHISVASLSSGAARVAAERGWGMLSANTVAADTVASHWAIYRETCAATGRRPRGDDWRVARNVLVAPSESQARDGVFGDRGANCFFYTYLHNAQRALGVAEPMSAAAMTEQFAIYGSPQSTLDRLVDFRDTGRSVRRLADHRPRLERAQQGVGIGIDAPAGAGGDAEIPPARARPCRCGRRVMCLARP